MTSPFDIPAMHALKKRVFRGQAEALASLGPKPRAKPKPGEQPDVVPNPPATGKPFDTAELRNFRRRARRRVDLDTLRVLVGQRGADAGGAGQRRAARRRRREPD